MLPGARIQTWVPISHAEGGLMSDETSTTGVSWIFVFKFSICLFLASTSAFCCLSPRHVIKCLLLLISSLLVVFHKAFAAALFSNTALFSSNNKHLGWQDSARPSLCYQGFLRHMHSGWNQRQNAIAATVRYKQSPGNTQEGRMSSQKFLLLSLQIGTEQLVLARQSGANQTRVILCLGL